MSTRQARRRQQRVRQQGGGTGPRRARPTTPWYLEWYAIVGAVAAVIIVIVIIVVVGNSNKTAAGKQSNFTSTPVSKTVLNAVEDPSSNLVSQVDTGGVTNQWVTKNGKYWSVGGKPILLYVGAEYCPFCAAERWAMINALSRFGTFSNLHTMRSSSTDSYPNTATFTFLHSSYTSPYITFIPREIETRIQGQRLQSLTPHETHSFDTYSNSQGFPFLDLADRAVIQQVTYDPTSLRSDATSATSAPLSWGQIASSLHNSSDPITQGVVGSANWLTAGICKMTDNKPASACENPTIQKLQSQLKFTK